MNTYLARVELKYFVETVITEDHLELARARAKLVSPNTKGVETLNLDVSLVSCFKTSVPRKTYINRARGGHARAAALTPERRSEIARKAANKRWGN